MIFSLVLIILTSAIIFIAGNYFATASSLIGQRLGLSKSVKGATLDAVSSSLPELMIALFSVISFGEFEVGVGTIAGSALFNLLVIPAVSIFIAKGSLQVSREVYTRDNLFHVFSKVILAFMVIFLSTWNSVLASILLLFYVVYVVVLTKNKLGSSRDKSLPFWSKRKIFFVGCISLLFVAGASYVLTQRAIVFANQLQVPPLLIAFTVIAVATSLPDMVISLVNAKKNSGDDAVANILASNTFDILVGIGLPLLLVTLSTGAVSINIAHPELIGGLLFFSVLFGFMIRGGTLNRYHAWILLSSYLLVIAYVALL